MPVSAPGGSSRARGRSTAPPRPGLPPRGTERRDQGRWPGDAGTGSVEPAGEAAGGGGLTGIEALVSASFVQPGLLLDPALVGLPGGLLAAAERRADLRPGR